MTEREIASSWKERRRIEHTCKDSETNDSQNFLKKEEVERKKNDCQAKGVDLLNRSVKIISSCLFTFLVPCIDFNRHITMEGKRGKGLFFTGLGSVRHMLSFVSCVFPEKIVHQFAVFCEYRTASPLCLLLIRNDQRFNPLNAESRACSVLLKEKTKRSHDTYTHDTRTSPGQE